MTDSWFGEIIHRNARQNADGLAFVEGGRGLTHAAYLARAEALAAALRARGIARMDRVALLSMNRIEYMEVCGACELTGFIAATVNFRLSAHELRVQLRDCAPAAIFFESSYTSLIEEIRADLPSIGTWICFDDGPDWAEPYEEVMSAAAGQVPDVASTIEDIAYLVYTSGSTGRPKGCILGSRELTRKAEQHASDLGITSDDRLLIVMPLFHVGARGVSSAGQWRGAAVHIQRSFDPAVFIRTVEAERISIAHLAPTMVQMVVEHPLAATADFSSLRAILYSAAAMPGEVLRKALELFGPVFHQAYGQTEGIVSCLPRHHHKPNGSEQEKARLLSVGQPYPGVEVMLVDDAGRDVTHGGTGEIVYRGGAMFRGYWNDSVATLAAWRDGWLHSGDIGRFDADGFLYIVDRKKDMIVTGGENVASREVEDALLRHPQVAEAAVIGVPHSKWGETVHAVVVLRDGATLGETEIIEHCRLFLASFKKPTGVSFVEALPKLANGKVDKLSLRQRWSAEGSMA
ncbi:acyl-CoA synthetase (AMP-forming)/AMP-acid ligase II [Sphingobium wenxiniae]|uniref:3-methylmercaptopropionyl-CoA ligase n=1 Tax=Sphingobium wenxiniae (strain DSM 21828 / CGMCC 1.7748 / JZ-1) TaxID=595605 RepID=A0A562K7N8_SPHWJ|nr:AMP-binding protein [Sphingobium wenxiniae]MBB6193488.1 acyl-CoA synthetase (AMP-forming)/AMP-acid ligase II [Sphingobium wenxiniae]TWH91438.1 acyl-CoA synthetase (AMP-forming)/AMP-acid ligase II [Sphingobium wenxiniae]